MGHLHKFSLIPRPALIILVFRPPIFNYSKIKFPSPIHRPNTFPFKSIIGPLFYSLSAAHFNPFLFNSQPKLPGPNFFQQPTSILLNNHPTNNKSSPFFPYPAHESDRTQLPLFHPLSQPRLPEKIEPRRPENFRSYPRLSHAQNLSPNALLSLLLSIARG